jgi:hypothetical protein
MADKSNKPLGTFAKLMSSSTIKDSPIKEELEQISGKPENLKTGIQEIRETGKPENRKTGIPENLKAIKYCTQLHKETIMRLKQYALVNDVKDYIVVEEALTEYLNKRQLEKPENLKT